jgi:plastocyanin
VRRIAALVLSIALAGCSTPDQREFSPPDRVRLSDGSEAVDRGEFEAELGTVQIRMVEFAFEPTVVTAPAGSELEVELVNAGDNVHGFEASAQGIDTTLAEGDRQTVSIAVPENGAVVFECKFHLPRAMRGEVRAG